MKSMFAPSTCFKVVPMFLIISYCSWRYIYHHSAHSSVTAALVFTAFPAFAGIIGLLEGFEG